MIQHMLLVLRRFAKKWVFNYEDDYTAMARLERELQDKKK
jgi:hypothetical protein